MRLKSSLILRLATKGRLGLDDKFADYVSDDLISKLHVLDGKDYSREITLKQMISQTSGLPDYIEDKQKNGHIAIKDLVAGLDPAWPIEKVVEEVKKMKPYFPPGEQGKAKYIDTNHQLLELVVEKVWLMNILVLYVMIHQKANLQFFLHIVFFTVKVI